MRAPHSLLLAAGMMAVSALALTACNKPAASADGSVSTPISDGYVHFAGSGGVLCDARPLSIDGSHARVEVTGACRAIRVTGEHNDVIVGMAGDGTIVVSGAHNDIWWHMAGRGRLPNLRDSGASNSFHREDG